MNFNHHLHFGDSTSVLGAGASLGFWLVLASYVLYFVAQLLLVFHGFRLKSYGMPLLSSAMLLAIAFACVIGPHTRQSHLFYDASKWNLVVVWVLSFLLQALIFAQYLRWGPSQPHRHPLLGQYFHPIAWVALSLSFGFVWLFIVFYQDYYVNEIFPLSTLLMAVGYVGTLYTRMRLRGLSEAAAWIYTVAIALLYLGTALGDMSQPFPEAMHGYGLIYFIWTLTVALMVAYSVSLGQRRSELQA
jgi:hypothetical protein